MGVIQELSLRALYQKKTPSSRSGDIPVHDEGVLLCSDS